MFIDWNIKKYRCDDGYRQSACVCKSTGIFFLGSVEGRSRKFQGGLRARDSLKKEEGGVRHPSGESCVVPDSFDAWQGREGVLACLGT